tara:strand:+ start:93 stop:440 length:348 start_codon:yes stop_codon:yes gene_type:complete
LAQIEIAITVVVLDTPRVLHGITAIYQTMLMTLRSKQMTTVRTIFYIDDPIDHAFCKTVKDVIETSYCDTTDLSMEEWLIQHNESRGADINDKEGEETGARWEEEDEFLVFETQI